MIFIQEIFDAKLGVGAFLASHSPSLSTRSVAYELGSPARNLRQPVSDLTRPQPAEWMGRPASVWLDPAAYY